MSDQATVRAALGVGFIAMLAIATYYRVRSWATRERLDRRQEGWFILATLRPAGLALWVSVVTWLVSPARMEWSALAVPGWVRCLGVGIFTAGVSLLAWTLGDLGANLTDTVVTRRAHTLVTRGPYRWVRHPFYDAM